MDLNPDAAWGVRCLSSGIWCGCIGPAGISRLAAVTLAARDSAHYQVERNPADVLAEQLARTDSVAAVALLES